MCTRLPRGKYYPLHSAIGDNWVGSYTVVSVVNKTETETELENAIGNPNWLGKVGPLYLRHFTKFHFGLSICHVFLSPRCFVKGFVKTYLHVN